jgi:hypothetical protein
MAIIISRFKRLRRAPKRKKSGRVFRMCKWLDDGSFLVFGRVERFNRYWRRPRG